MVCGVNYHSLDARLRYPTPTYSGRDVFSWPNAPPHLSRAAWPKEHSLWLRNLMDTLFAEGYEIQIRCTNDGFGIWKANKHYFVSARLQLARKRGHGIQVSCHGHTHKTEFHSYSPCRRLNGPQHLAKATVHGLVDDEPVLRYKEHAWSSFIPG